MAIATFPPWVHVGAILTSGLTRYTVTRVIEDRKVVVLRRHMEALAHNEGLLQDEVGHPLDVVARNFKPVTDLKHPWMRVGVRLATKDGGIVLSTIIGFADGNIHLRDIEGGSGGLPPSLGGTIRLFTPSQIEQLFTPVEFERPRWLGVGSRIVQRHDSQTFEVQEVDFYTGSLSAFRLNEPKRLQRFNLNDFEKHWRPFSTFDGSLYEETKTTYKLAPAVIPNAAIPTAPGWLQPGGLIRPQARNMRRSFWVMSIHPDRGMCRIQRVKTFSPLMMESAWEELAFEVAEKDWEPLNEDGSPLSEKSCPHCGTWGGRLKEAEEGSPYQIRVYHCPQAHRWSFIDGGNDDGKPAPPTRFERDFDL
jgi:hypothetical protein